MSNIVDIRKSMPRHPRVKVSRRNLSDIRTIAVHHSLTTSGTPQAFANYHINTNGWSIMGYAYVIQRDGTIYWCADHDIITPHVGTSNRQALGVCMVGDFRQSKQKEPTKAQYDSLIWLINYLQEILPNTLSIKGHQEYPGTLGKTVQWITKELSLLWTRLDETLRTLKQVKGRGKS